MKIENIHFLQVIASVGLVVLIWIIQLVHYPSFAYYEEKDFTTAMAFHQSRITMIVLPLMMVELISVFYLCWKSPNGVHLAVLIMVLLIWASTFFIQVPLHQKLLSGKDVTLISKLVSTNWIRTCLWTLKLAILLSVSPRVS